MDAFGNVFIADTNNNRIRKISPNGIIITYVGNGTPDVLNAPQGVVVDASGNLYIADTGNNRIRVVDPSGGITTLVGSANGLKQPAGIAVAPSGGLLFAGTGNNAIYQITTETAMGPGGNALVVEGVVLNLPPSNNAQPSIGLVPAQNSSLALIATLMVTSFTGGESQDMSVGSAPAIVSPNQAIAPSGEGDEGAHAADDSGNPLGSLSILISPALGPWVLVLLGTNEALARIGGTNPDLFTFGDGQQGPVNLLSRAYQVVVQTIDKAIPFLVSQGDPISLAGLPVPTVAGDIDEVASDLALEEPFEPRATPSDASAATDAVHRSGEVLARPKNLWRVGLVGGFIAGSMVVTANAVKRIFQRHRHQQNRSGTSELGAGTSAMGLT